MSKDSDLLKLKKEYEVLAKKYNLPSFKEMNEDFGIERIAEVETDILLREIRKVVADKLYNYLRFIEGILNPTNAPMFVFSIIKALGKEEKDKFSEIYKKLAKIEIALFEIDVQFFEEKEAKFVKDSYGIWQEIKKDALEIIKAIKRNWDNKAETKDKGYFG